MKALFTFLFITIIGSSFAQTHYFVGTYSQRGTHENIWCFTRTMIKYPISSSSQYDSLRNLLYQEHAKDYPEAYLLKPGSAAIIYQLKIIPDGYKCEQLTIRVLHGSSLEAIREMMEKRISQNPQKYPTTPDEIFTWSGSPVSKVIEKKYDGLSLKFTQIKRADNTVTVIIQGRNTSKYTLDFQVVKAKTWQNQEAFVANGAVSSMKNVAPGGSFVLNIKTTDFNIEWKFKEKGEKQDFMDVIKRYVRSPYMREDTIRRQSGSTGVRG